MAHHFTETFKTNAALKALLKLLAETFGKKQGKLPLYQQKLIDERIKEGTFLNHGNDQYCINPEFIKWLKAQKNPLAARIDAFATPPPIHDDQPEPGDPSVPDDPEPAEKRKNARDKAKTHQEAFEAQLKENSATSSRITDTTRSYIYATAMQQLHGGIIQSTQDEIHEGLNTINASVPEKHIFGGRHSLLSPHMQPADTNSLSAKDQISKKEHEAVCNANIAANQKNEGDVYKYFDVKTGKIGIYEQQLAAAASTPPPELMKAMQLSSAMLSGKDKTGAGAAELDRHIRCIEDRVLKEFAENIRENTLATQKILGNEETRQKMNSLARDAATGKAGKKTEDSALAMLPPHLQKIYKGNTMTPVEKAGFWNSVAHCTEKKNPPDPTAALHLCSHMGRAANREIREINTQMATEYANPFLKKFNEMKKERQTLADQQKAEKKRKRSDAIHEMAGTVRGVLDDAGRSLTLEPR